MGSWQLWLMPRRTAPPRDQLAETCFLGKPGCTFCGMGLEAWDLSGSKLAALPIRVQIALLGPVCGSRCPIPPTSLEASHLFTLRTPPPLSAWGLAHGLPGSRQPREPRSGAIQPEPQVGRENQAQQATGLVLLDLGKRKGST